MGSNAISAITFFLLLLLTVNALLLDIVVFSKREQPSETVAVSLPSPTPSAEACPTSCMALIEAGLEASVPVAPTPTRTVRTVAVQTAAKEYYIPFGSGSTDSREWKELPGVEAYIDTANYPSIKEVVLEVYLSIPTANGQVYAKLYNVTDKHDVWFSDVWSETNTVLRKEAKISLDTGNKLYRLMMKSTLGYPALLSNARVKIVTK